MNPLKFSDFIEKDDNNTIQQLIDYLNELLKIYKETSDLIKKQAKETADSIKQVSGAREEDRQLILQATQTQEELLGKEKNLNSERNIAQRRLVAITQAQKEKRQIDKLIVEINNSKINSYKRLSAEYRLGKIVVDQMNDAEKRNGKTKKELEADLKRMYQQMSKMQQATGKYTLEVGHYQNAISSIPAPLQQVGRALGDMGSNMKAIYQSDMPAMQKGINMLSTGFLGLVGIVVAVGKALKGAISTNVEFEQANVNLATVLGVTNKEIEDLTETALTLGRTTEWTASQVTQLQMELAKLGFGKGSIISMQDSVLAFATAMGADLGEAATMAGAALRAFNLTSKDSEEAMGVLAVGVNKSALSFDRIKYSMGTVFPIANAFGLSIKDATALLGALANAGFSAESAATATRNMLLNLADANGKLAKRTGGAAKSFNDIIDKLELLRNEGADLSEIFELTDKRSVAAFNALMSGTETAKALRASLEDVGGELKRIQQQRLDSVQGQTLLLKSAWQGLVLSIRESNGVLKQWVQDATNLIQGLQRTFFTNATKTQEAEERFLDKFQSYYKDAGAELTKTYMKEWLTPYRLELDELAKDESKKGKKRYEEALARYQGFYNGYKIMLEKIQNDEEEAALQEQLKRQETTENAIELSKEQKQQRLKDLQAVIDAIKMEIAATEEGDERRKQLYVDLVNAERNLALEKNRQAEATAKIDEDIINAMYDKEAEDAEKKYFKEIEKLRENYLRQEQQAVQLEIGITEEGTQKMLDLRLKNIEIQHQIEIAQNNQKEEKLRQSQADIDKKYDKLRLDEIKKYYLTMAKREVEAASQIRESQFNMEIHNEREKTIFKLGEEKKRLRALLEMDKLAVDKMTKTEKEAIIKQMQEINVEMERLGFNNIYEVLGISLSSQQQDSLNTALQATKDNLKSITDSWKEAADAAVESANKQVEAAQKILEGEIEARQKGYASREDSARKELEQAKKNQQQALKEQERAKNAQLRLDSLQQASSLTTASANIWKAFSGTGPWGIALAIAGIAAMWTSFISAQIKARQVTKYGEGTVELLEGGSHASGHDIDLGYDAKKRRHRRAEGGEYFAVINKRSSRKYGHVIKDVITSFNDGTFADKYVKASENMSGMAAQIIGGGTDISSLEKKVEAIRKQGEKQVYSDGDYIIIRNSNLIQRIRKN